MQPYVLALTGASAQPIAERLLYVLLKSKNLVHLIVSKGAYTVWKAERGINVPIEPIKQKMFWEKYLDLDTSNLITHKWSDMSVDIASGSYRTKGMLIVPCSMGTVGRINSGVSHNLIERCADVHLKERRKLLISPREMPLSLIHLRNLTSLAEAGAIIVPPIPAWYSNPKTIGDMIDFLVGRILDSFDDKFIDYPRWSGPVK